MSHLLSIDIGTSSVKALIFDVESAQIVAKAAEEYPIHTPQPGFAEQDPDDWWRAALAVVKQVVGSVDPSSIAGIGLTGQMHGTVLLDADARPLHRAIIWADGRSSTQTERLVAPFGETQFSAIAGTLPAAGFMGPTLLWIAENAPNLLEKTRHVLLPKDYVRLKLTGQINTDVTDAAATALFDIAAGDWSDGIINAVNLRRAIFPDVLPSESIAGQLTKNAAEQLGLPLGIPIVAGCADQPAQALANGLITPRKASVTIGTGGQVFRPIMAGHDQAVPTDPRIHVFNHALPDMWYGLGATLSAGLSLRWLRNLVGLSDTPDAYAILSAEAARVAIGADGLLYLPYLLGERTPHMDANARGVFIGLSYHHERSHLAQAVMEGVTFGLRQALEIVIGLGGEVESLIVTGGGAESPLWRQIQADVFGLPLQRSTLTEQTSIGAALLAGVDVGLYSSIHEASASITNNGDITEPNMQNHAIYDDIYAQFCELYPKLTVDFDRLSARR